MTDLMREVSVRNILDWALISFRNENWSDVNKCMEVLENLPAPEEMEVN